MEPPTGAAEAVNAGTAGTGEPGSAADGKVGAESTGICVSKKAASDEMLERSPSI